MKRLSILGAALIAVAVVSSSAVAAPPVPFPNPKVADVFIAGDWVGPHFQLADASSASGEAAARRALASLASRPRVGV